MVSKIATKMRKRNQIHPPNGGDVSDQVTIDDLVYKKNHLALNLTEEIQQLMPETITPLNFIDIFRALFWNFLMTWFPRLAIPPDVILLLDEGLKDSYLKVYLRFILKLEDRQSIDQLQLILPLFCTEMVRIMILKKVKDHKRTLASNDVYIEILAFVYSKIQQDFPLTQITLLKLRRQFIKSSSQINALKIE